ncbi:MAG: hypothetical protein HKN22_08645, partial [Bacteroidia bacterium]|nr:hypothetical protein [Bacteroidia bacterium]
MNKLIPCVLMILLGSFFSLSSFSQGTPCMATSGQIGTVADCSGQLTTSGSWTIAGLGIVDPTPSSTCLTSASTPAHNHWITYTVPTGITSMRLRFQGKTNGNASVRLHNISVQVYTANSCLGTFTLVACYNDAGSTVDQTLAVSSGTVYYFRVFDADGSSTASNEFNYCINVTHEGNNPCIAIPISSFPYSYSGNTSNAGITNFMNGGCNGNDISTSGFGNDLFFSLTLAANSYVKLQLTGTNASNYSELSVLTYANCTSGPFTCHPNGSWDGGLQASSPDSSDTPCRTVYFQNAGNYIVRVDSDVDEGAFTLLADTYTPSNSDACLNAQVLAPATPVTINSTNCNYTVGNDDPMPPSLFCAGTVENTNWFYFQSDGSGNNVVVTVSNVTCNRGYYTYIPGPPGPGGYAFYSAQGQFGIVTSSTTVCGGTYTSAAACQTVIPGNTYNVTLPNSAVTNYFMIWDGNGGAECKYQISVTNVNPLPVQLSSFDALRNDDVVN